MPTFSMLSATPSCPHCHSHHVIKWGKALGFQGRQKYHCQSCNKHFTDNGALPGDRVPAEQISLALGMLFLDGLTYRDVQQYLRREFGTRASMCTIWKWVGKYGGEEARLMRERKANRPACPECQGLTVNRDGKRNGVQFYRCTICQRRFKYPTPAATPGR